MEACTSAGAAKYGTPLGLNASIKVDMIIVGSSAVSQNGARLGKGEVGYMVQRGVESHALGTHVARQCHSLVTMHGACKGCLLPVCRSQALPSLLVASFS